MKESQTVTTTVKIYFQRKIQSVKEFHQIGNEISLIIHGSFNKPNMDVMDLLCNVISLSLLDTKKKTETFLKNVK